LLAPSSAEMQATDRDMHVRAALAKVWEQGRTMGSYLGLLEDAARSREAAVRSAYRLHAVKASGLTRLANVVAGKPNSVAMPASAHVALGKQQQQLPQQRSTPPAAPVSRSGSRSSARVGVRVGSSDGKKKVDFTLPSVPADLRPTTADTEAFDNGYGFVNGNRENGQWNANSVREAADESHTAVPFLSKLRPTGLREMVEGADCGMVHDEESIDEEAALYRGMLSYGVQGIKAVLLAKIARLQRRTTEFSESTLAYDANLLRPAARVLSTITPAPVSWSKKQGTSSAGNGSSLAMAQSDQRLVEGSLLLAHCTAAANIPLAAADSFSLPKTLHNLLCVRLPVAFASLCLAPHLTANAGAWAAPTVPLLGLQPVLAQPLRSDALQAFLSLCAGRSPVGCRQDHLDLFSADELGWSIAGSPRTKKERSSHVNKSSERTLHCTQLATLGSLSVPLLRSSVPGALMFTLPSLVTQAIRADAGAEATPEVVASFLACACSVDSVDSVDSGDSGDKRMSGVHLLSNLLANLLHRTPFAAVSWAEAHLRPAHTSWAAFQPGDEAACLLFLGTFLQLVRHVSDVSAGGIYNGKDGTRSTEVPVSISVAVAARALHAAFLLQADASDMRMIETHAESCVSYNVLGKSTTSHDKQLPDVLTALNEMLSMVGLGLTGCTATGKEPPSVTVMPKLPDGPAPSGGAFLRGSHGGSMHVQAVLADLATGSAARVENSVGENSRYRQQIPDYTQPDGEASEDSLRPGDCVTDLFQRRLLFYKAADFEVKRDGVLLPPKSSRRLQPSAAVPKSHLHGSDGRLKHCLEVTDSSVYERAVQQLLARTREERVKLGWDEEKEKAAARRQQRKGTRVARQRAIISNYIDQTANVYVSDVESVVAMAMLDDSASDHSSDGFSSGEESSVLPSVSTNTAAQPATLTLYDLQKQKKKTKKQQNLQTATKIEPKDKKALREAAWPAMFAAAALPRGSPLPEELWPHVLSGAAGGLQVDPVELAVRLLPLHLLQRRRVCQMVHLNQLWHSFNPCGAAVLSRGRWIDLVESLNADSGRASLDMQEAEKRWMRAVDGGIDSSDGGMTFAAFAAEMNLLVQEGVRMTSEGLPDHKSR